MHRRQLWSLPTWTFTDSACKNGTFALVTFPCKTQILIHLSCGALSGQAGRTLAMCSSRKSRRCFLHVGQDYSSPTVVPKVFLCDCGVICFFLLCIKRAKSSCLPWLHYLVIVKSCRTLRYCHKALADLFVSRDIGDIVHLTNAIKMLLAVQTVFQPFTQYIHTCGFLLPFFFFPHTITVDLCTKIDQ